MNWHKKHLDGRSLGERMADAIASFAGSMKSVYLHSMWFAVWILFKIEQFPYGLLTMVVSLEAIFLSTFIMISSNRAGDRDRHAAEHDYAVNERSMADIEMLMTKLDKMESEKLDHIIRLLTRE